MSNPQPVLNWMQRRAAQYQPAVQETPVATLTEKMHPFLQDADRALAENARLRDQVAQLQQELRYSHSMQDAAADRIDVLEEEVAVATKEAALLKARMKIFGEAANAIITASSREAKEAYVPKRREVFEPTEQQAVRPVKPIDEVKEEEPAPHIAILSSSKLFKYD